MERISVTGFINKVLAGVAMGIVVGLIPNAILGELFKFLSNTMIYLQPCKVLLWVFNLPYR